MSFLHEEFLLQSPTARRLYHEYAEHEPILDYHCHLPPADIASNRQFRDLFEIWLEGDHYKWRAMRANGVPEDLCTGAASPRDKFFAWARTVPFTLRNPLYHWTHLELKRYFGIEDILDETSAPAIWDRANEQLAGPSLRAHGILARFGVNALCTTDDPTDSLEHHKAIAASHLETKVFPAFRPDKALAVDFPERFNAWVAALERAASLRIRQFEDLLLALQSRHDFFHSMGCRLSDHGLNHCFAEPSSEGEVEGIFDRARNGIPASPSEHAQFATALMLFFGRLDARKGWTKQLHLGALRGVNARLLARCGPDTGFDSIADFPQAASLAQYLDTLDRANSLPKTVIYNLNPADNYVFASMAGNFQDGSVPGKIQFGSGWWFLDQKDAMEWQMNALSNCGLLSRFIGMLTDSRSFMSYPRHEYFRRVLCNLIGQDVELGLLPGDVSLLGPMIRNICYRNAHSYLGLDIP
jgi:glucuronate isomerase